MSEIQRRQTHVDLQRDDVIEIVHYIKVGFTEHKSHTIGVANKVGVDLAWMAGLRAMGRQVLVRPLNVAQGRWRADNRGD